MGVFSQVRTTSSTQRTWSNKQYAFMTLHLRFLRQCPQHLHVLIRVFDGIGQAPGATSKFVADLTAAPETFWCVMCMMYSDYYRVARNHGVDTPDFYADMAAAFLQDAAAVPNMAGRYDHCVAQAM